MRCVVQGMAVCSEGICVKAMLAGAGDARFGRKVFVNVTHYKEIAAASQEDATDEDGD